MTLAVGNKLIKCDESGVPVKNESYVLFEIVALMNDPNPENVYKPLGTQTIVVLKKLDDPKPAESA